jgi:hypothetical protein
MPRSREAHLMARRLSRLLVLFVTVLTLSVLTPLAAYAGQGCTTLWTPSGKGHANMCKTWDSNGDGTYEVHYWGTAYGSIRADIYIDGYIETISYGGGFEGIIAKARKVYFRACNGGCAAWW